MMRLEHSSFFTNEPVENLKPVEALALINRWAKLKSYFYYDDIDALYELKDRKVKELVEAGEMVATAVIARESPAIAAMKVQLANGGEDIEFLDSFLPCSDFLPEAENERLRLLYDLVYKFGIEVEYPADIYERWLRQLQPEIEAYQAAKLAYDLELQRRTPLVTAYSQQLSEYNQNESIAAQKWAQANNIKIARSNSGKSLKPVLLKRLKNQGFRYELPPPVNPFPQQLKLPTPVEIPSPTFKVDISTYLPGSIPKVEEALNWCKTVVGDSASAHAGLRFPQHTSEIDDYFLCFELESTLRELELDKIRQQILKIFSDVIEGRINNPKDIWEQLIIFEIDYGTAIGMNSYIDRWGNTSQRDFGKWHEINLSPTGHWSIEFQSLSNPTITFHAPYNNQKILPPATLNNLPLIWVEQAKFGREISTWEQKQYPLLKLLEILGYSADDFPFNLDKCEPQRSYSYTRDWSEEEDWDGDGDEVF